MPSITIEAVPAAPGRPAGLKINSDLDAAEAVVLLERAKALLLGQNVPKLDGEPRAIEEAPAGLLKTLNGRG